MLQAIIIVVGLLLFTSIMESIYADPRLKFPQELRVQTAQKFSTIQIPLQNEELGNLHDLKIAVVMSGHIRSFAFAEKSWQRYMHKGISQHLYFFANALATKRCRISSIGIDILDRICTEYTVSYANMPLVSVDEIRSRLPTLYSQSENFSNRVQQSVFHGNYFDMHRRRHIAYTMADRYAHSYNFRWDLIMYTRFDIAFYDPVMDLAGWYTALRRYHESGGGRGIISPPSCNFHGVCDRFAVGRPEEMALYFQEGLPFAVLEWSATPVEPHVETNISADIAPSDRLSVLSFVKVHQQSPRGNSEHLLECWFIMNNLTQLWVDAAPVSFATLRSAHATSYCALDRASFIETYQPQDPSFLEVDRCTAAADVSPYRGFDMVKSKTQRCGALVASLNSSALCSDTSCACGRWG